MLLSGPSALTFFAFRLAWPITARHVAALKKLPSATAPFEGNVAVPARRVARHIARRTSQLTASGRCGALGGYSAHEQAHAEDAHSLDRAEHANSAKAQVRATASVCVGPIGAAVALVWGQVTLVQTDSWKRQ